MPARPIRCSSLPPPTSILRLNGGLAGTGGSIWLTAYKLYSRRSCARKVAASSTAREILGGL